MPLLKEVLFVIQSPCFRRVHRCGGCLGYQLNLTWRPLRSKLLRTCEGFSCLGKLHLPIYDISPVLYSLVGSDLCLYPSACTIWFFLKCTDRFILLLFNWESLHFIKYIVPHMNHFSVSDLKVFFTVFPSPLVYTVSREICSCPFSAPCMQCAYFHPSVAFIIFSIK